MITTPNQKSLHQGNECSNTFSETNSTPNSLNNSISSNKLPGEKTQNQSDFQHVEDYLTSNNHPNAATNASQQPNQSQPHSNTSRVSELSRQHNTLRDIYLDIPDEVSHVLMETGITSLLNCIEIQKKLILTTHYLVSQSTKIFGMEADQTVLLKNAIAMFLRDDYLQNEIKNFERNENLFDSLLKKIELLFNDDKADKKRLTPVMRFLKQGRQHGASFMNRVSNAAGASSAGKRRSDEQNELFRRYYHLKEHDIIDEAEDIATHLMNELTVNQSKPVYQELKYSDKRIFEGFYKNGKRNGQGTLKFANGDIYDGEWQENKMQGKGVYKFNSGAVYKGDFFNNQRHGEGEYFFNDGKRYIGTWRKGKRNGTGKIQWPKGDTYIGYFVNGKRDGTGIFKAADGASYEGSWKSGKRDGEGKLKRKNGDVYFGRFKRDKISGYGTMQYADGKVYEGEWKNGKRNGDGVLTLPTGDRFLGNFVDDYLNGYGECYFSNGSVYRGIMVNSKKEGKGEYMWPSGDKYTGDYKNCKRHGYGIYEYANGNRFKGNWHNDKEQGEGYLKIENIEVHGVWKNGVLIKELSAQELAPSAKHKTPCPSASQIKRATAASASAERSVENGIGKSSSKLSQKKVTGFVQSAPPQDSENDTEDHLNLSSKNLIGNQDYIS